MRKQAVPFLPFILLTWALICPAQVAPARPMKIKVTAEQANLREKPDIGSAIVQQIPEGTVLEADKKEGEWFFVRFALEDGGVIGGYIHESLVEVVEAAAAAVPAKTAPRTTTPPASGAAVAAATRPAARGLSLSLSGGAGWVAPRDLNDGAAGFAGYTGASLGLPSSGDVDLLHMATLAGLELSYRLSDRLALGFGVDYFWGQRKSRVEYMDEVAPVSGVTEPFFSSIPVKVTARFYPGRGFYIRGSLGVYFVSAGYTYRLEGTDAWQEWKGKATGNCLGGEAAFGGEWAIGKKTSMFVEGGFRLANATELSGENVYSDSAGDSLTETGKLYFFRKEGADLEVYPLVFVRQSPPAEEGVVDSRLAGVNLSGTYVRVGFRFRI